MTPPPGPAAPLSAPTIPRAVVVAGASGFIGSRLCPALARAGHTVRAMTRDPSRYRGTGEPVFGDIADPTSLRTALTGSAVAYYLVHSLRHADFEQRDAVGARAFAEAAASAGVERIVYLGGLGATDDDRIRGSGASPRREASFSPCDGDVTDASGSGCARRGAGTPALGRSPATTSATPGETGAERRAEAAREASDFGDSTDR